MKKVLKVIGNIVITVVVIFACVLTVSVISSVKSEAGIPNIAGKAVFNVETDSMEGENGFPAGALIIVDLVDKEEARHLKIGDVITYRTQYNGASFLDTHRIIEVIERDGEIAYMTKGDNTVTFDAMANYSGNVIGVWTGTAIPKLGSVMKFLQSQFGFMICVVAPMAIFFIFELYKFIVTLMEGKKEKAVAAVSEAEDEIKQKAIAEFLAKQEAEKAEAQKAADEDDIKKKAVEEYLARQEAEKAAAQKAAEEEEIKRKAVEEYLAKQAAENNKDE